MSASSQPRDVASAAGFDRASSTGRPDALAAGDHAVLGCLLIVESVVGVIGVPARVRHSVAVVAVVLAAVGVLVGCESDRERPSATLPPLSTSSATPTPSEDGLPGPEGYPIPVEAQAYTPEGATAFVAYYIDLLNQTGVSLDSAPLRYLSRTCERCDEIATAYEEDRDAGNRRVGGSVTPIQFGDVTLYTPDGGGPSAILGVVVNQTERQTLNSTDGIVDSAPALDLIADIDLVWISDESREWHVSRLATNPVS